MLPVQLQEVPQRSADTDVNFICLVLLHVMDFCNVCRDTAFYKQIIGMQQVTMEKCCNCLLQTPLSHRDHSMLEQAVSAVEEVIAEVDIKTGLSKCQFAVSQLHYVDDRQVEFLFIVVLTVHHDLDDFEI